IFPSPSIVGGLTVDGVLGKVITGVLSLPGVIISTTGTFTGCSGVVTTFSSLLVGGVTTTSLVVRGVVLASLSVTVKGTSIGASIGAPGFGVITIFPSSSIVGGLTVDGVFGKVITGVLSLPGVKTSVTGTLTGCSGVVTTFSFLLVGGVTTT